MSPLRLGNTSAVTFSVPNTANQTYGTQPKRRKTVYFHYSKALGNCKRYFPPA